MSDRQTPTSVLDRARSSILKFRASVIGMPLPSRLLMTERDLRDLADQIQSIGIRHPEVGPGFVQQMTADQFRDHVVNRAAKGELYLWGVKVVIDDATLEIRCEGATRGVKEYRGDQHAGVDNSVQAAQGCRVAAGVSDGADLCTLGTADFPIRSGHDVVADMERAFAAMAQRDPILAAGMADVFLYPGEFDMVVRAQGIEAQSLAGQQYWEWQGGGIRYWRGRREMPRG